MKLLLFSFLIFAFPLLSNPWGKDADLALCRKVECLPQKRTSFLSQVGTQAIRFHQEVISPADGPRSHFIPSSSQYTVDAMQRYGFFKGYAMGCDRLMRENGDMWVYRTVPDERGRLLKWDPVK
ncbi:MAG: membrane protein insertion efficiency factor YidD [Candidatus Protochlamydia sp.]|nr:membrane protein insertion efficiency factor YidD [Candidatus Protochlamydia sp.]